MFSTYYLFMALSYAAVCAVAFYTYLAWRKDKGPENIGKHIGALGVLIILPALMNLLWAFSALPPTSQDALFINGIFSIAVPAIMLVIIYKLTCNRNLLYLLLLFAITFVSLPYSFSKFFVSVMIAANILFLLVSLDVLIIRRYHIQFAGVTGVLTSLTSISFSVMLYFGADYSGLWWFIPNFMLALMLFILHLDQKYYSLISPRESAHRRPHVRRVLLWLLFIRYMLYIMGVAAITLISTVSVHELGHAITASYYGCDPARIVYDLHKAPYTEIGCPGSGTPIFIITLAGILLVLVAVAVFFLAEGSFTTRLAELMLGFGFLISYSDLRELGVSQNILALIVMLSLLIVLAAIFNFSLFYIRQHTRKMVEG
ncbi:MAG: hypothetical protein V1702_01800 [Candidatus Woesearchaeota archaeon]